ncbi:hypothetical protein AB0N07_24585 [Streptomyces sp. NPDC051172]|uniref:hypothetical protein n=1 Tax=Streptomyces sp. NPDC051172 TaxID=3155796 RepID=UPI003441633A
MEQAPGAVDQQDEQDDPSAQPDRAVLAGEHADRRGQVTAVGAEQVTEGADRVFVAVAVVERFSDDDAIGGGPPP